MAKFNLNFATIIDATAIHLEWMVTKAEFQDASASLTAEFKKIDTEFPGVFSLERSKGMVKFCVNPDAENLTDILVKTGEARSAVARAVVYRNDTYKAYADKTAEQDKYLGGKVGKKRLTEAFGIAVTGNKSQLADCYRDFLHELGMPEDMLDAGFDKWWGKMAPTFSVGQYSENCHELTGKFSETKGRKATVMMWASLHTFLTAGINTYKKDDKGEFVFKMGKNGKPTSEHEMVKFGGSFAVDFNEDECRLEYVSRSANGLAKTDTEGAKEEAKKAVEKAQAVA